MIRENGDFIYFRDAQWGPCDPLEKGVLNLASLEWIKSLGPYSHFFTVTFSSHVADVKRHDLYCKLVRKFNRSIHGKHCLKKGSNMNGFCFIEMHGNESIHFHTLVQYDSAYYVTGKRTFREHLVSSADELFVVSASCGRNVMSLKGLDCQPIHPEDDCNIKQGFYPKGKGDKLLHYCLDETKYNQELCTGKNRFRRINPLGPEGISARTS